MRNMRLYKKYIAMSLCAACVLGTSGCGTKDQETEVVNTVDEASDAESENVTDDLTEVISKSVDAGGDSDSTKDETVYIMADASGSDKEVIVSEWLKNPERKISADFIIYVSQMWKLPDFISSLLLESAGICLNRKDPRCRALEYIRTTLWDQGIDAANTFLTNNNMEILTI